MDVSFRQLRVFIAVAHQGSMARAAATLHVTPPAISMVIRDLEAQVGLPLFDREGRKLSLSAGGKWFLEHARKLMASLKEAEDAMARFRRLEEGLLTIGIVSTAKYFVPRLLARFRLTAPGVELRLRVAGNREALVNLMMAGEADLTVMGRPPRTLATRAEVFAQHPLVFVAPAGHPLLALGPLQVTDLADYSFIVREPGSGTRAAMEQYFAEQSFMPRITMDTSSNETIKQAVMAGMGLSFLSRHTLDLELRSGLLGVLDLEATPVMRTWNVVSLQSKLLSPAADRFRQFILAHGEAHLLGGEAPTAA
ncbi:MAG: LysR family transcriptional regulator [Gemmatimonadetes bacterium]|nr:LysR family transcriptional regulator [Gemmatimonadota bacterium]MBK7784192.1 LysR family transcriptional regulator [Gemmatimonadota bacterium]MBP9201371.1 LysR family transcriptional regulator [Gemmatimonadales bacterium]